MPLRNLNVMGGLFKSGFCRETIKFTACLELWLSHGTAGGRRGLHQNNKAVKDQAKTIRAKIKNKLLFPHQAFRDIMVVSNDPQYCIRCPEHSPHYCCADMDFIKMGAPSLPHTKKMSTLPNEPFQPLRTLLNLTPLTLTSKDHI